MKKSQKFTIDEAKVLENYSYQYYLDIANSTKERVELIFGKIYMMAGASAWHQDIVRNIFYLLKTISKTAQKCLPRIAPFDLKLEVNSEINIVQPDIMLFCGDKKKPCAIFEVLFPSTALKDKTVKKELYEQSGIREYFLVNAEYKIVEKFILTNGKYEYVGAYGQEDKIEIKCLKEKIELKEVFEQES